MSPQTTPSTVEPPQAPAGRDAGLLVSARGIVVRRADAPNKPGAIEVFNTSGGRRTGISADWFGGAEKVECRVQNEDGESWSEVSVRKEGGMYLFNGPSSGTRYALWPVR